MPESPKDELARRLSEYPKEAVSFFSSAFGVASRLPGETRTLVLNALIANFERGSRNLSGAALRHITDLSAREAEQVASAYSLMIGLLSDSTATPDDFVASAKGILFLPEQEATVRLIASSICALRPQINATVERAQLAGVVLPSFDDINIAVDFRARFANGALKTGVAVAVVHIDTDVSEQELWLQFSRGDVEDIIKKFSDCLEEMKLAETLFLRKS